MSETEDFNHGEAERYFHEGYEKQLQGNLSEAMKLYRKSIEICPTPEAHTFLGWAHSLAGEFQEAIEECHRAIRLDPEFGNPYNDIGSYLIELQKYDEALPWLEKAVQAKRYENYCYPHYNMGRVWERKGDWQKALSCYQNSIRENSQYTLAKCAVNRILAMMN